MRKAELNVGYEVVGKPPDVQKEFRAVIDKREGKHRPLGKTEQFAFMKEPRKLLPS